MVSWTWVRNQFPAAKKFLYFNAAGAAPISKEVADAGKGYYETMCDLGDIKWDKWLQQMEDARSLVGKFLGTTADNVAYTLNTSHGMSIIAHMMGGKGEVLTMADEFPSTTYPWLNRGYKLKFIEPEPDNTYPLKLIEKAITSKTKILVSSHIQYGTGFRQDVQALGRLAKRKKLTLVINGTQGFGVFPMQVEKWGVDFFAASCFKWGMAGYGTGVLYISRRKRRGATPPTVGWRSVRDPTAMDPRTYEPKEESSVVEGGCPHMPNILSLGAALTLFSKIGRKNITDRLLELTDRIIERLDKAGVEIISPGARKHRSGIVIARTVNADRIANEMFRRHRAFVAPRGDGVRFSPHIYNTITDCDKVVASYLDCLKNKKPVKAVKGDLKCSSV
ncbi:MAG: aminotransferase class V-fold PLP-dependent enzyme [Planctomycetota bacterium]|nr:MAG: aminotransferase class V-fold PLP-dependent enzyme [Planctomycetota bacterium]